MMSRPVDDPYVGARTVVLGAGGFIGRMTVRALLSRGAEVHAVVRTAKVEASAVHVLDLMRLEDVAAFLRRIDPDIVFNLAGYGVDRSETDAATALRLNAELPDIVATALPLEGSRGFGGLRLVHCGSAAEYGAATGHLDEDTTCLPTALYGRSKLQGTLIVARRGAERGLRCATARLFTVYGPGEHPGRLLPTLLDAARTGRRIDLSDGSQRRDFTYVEDVVAGLLRLGLSALPPGAILNLATGTLSTVKLFIEAAADVLGIRPEQLGFGAIPRRADEMEHDPVDVSRLRALLSWQPSTSIVEGIARTRDMTKET